MAKRTELRGLALLPSVLVAACSWGCSGEPSGKVATDVGDATSSSVEPDLGVPAAPCPFLHFGEIDVQWSLYSEAQAVVAADLDGDGLRDLVVSMDHAPIGFFRNRGRESATGTKTFDPGVYLDGSNSFGIGVTDWNQDGLPDIVGRSNHLQLIANRGDFVFETVRDEVPITLSSDYIAVADMDGDGREDILMYGGRGVTIYPAPDADGVLGEPFSVELGAAELTENSDTRIVAQVTDPDGHDDEIDGLLPATRPSRSLAST